MEIRSSSSRLGAPMAAALCLAAHRYVSQEAPAVTTFVLPMQPSAASAAKPSAVLSRHVSSTPVSGEAAGAVATLAGFAAAIGSRRRVQASESRVLLRAAKKGGGGKKDDKGKAKGGGGGAAKKGKNDDDDGDDGEEEEEVDTEEVMADFQEKMEKTLDLLRTTFVGIRAGKATPGLIESLKVTVYDSEVLLKEIASISVVDATTLNVACFDEANAPAVTKMILTSDFGYTAQATGANVKVMIPQMTKEKRVQFCKVAKDSAEKTRVAIRNVRQAAMKKVKGFKSLSEDVVRDLQDEVEEMCKKNIAECDKMLKKKEDELMTV